MESEIIEDLNETLAVSHQTRYSMRCHSISGGEEAKQQHSAGQKTAGNGRTSTMAVLKKGLEKIIRPSVSCSF